MAVGSPTSGWISAIVGGFGHAMGQAWGEPLLAEDAIAGPLIAIAAAIARGLGRRRGLDLAHAGGAQEADAEDVWAWQPSPAGDAPFCPMRGQ